MLNELFSKLRGALVSGRTDVDRYREFREVFLGTEQGKRVLHDIMEWCHMGHSSIPPGQFDTNQVLVNEGERRIGLKLLTALNVEPKAKPAQQKRSS